jgi:DNA-binding MarR family transcriptional regulator
VSTRPLPGPAEPDPELVARLRMAIARLARRLRQESDVGLTVSQLAALGSIQRHGAVTLGELAAVERVRPPTMTRIVAALEDAGLVVREPDARDRRIARVRTTPAGDVLLADIRTRRDAFLAEQLCALPDVSLAELERMVGMLEQISDAPRRAAAGVSAPAVGTRT